MAEGKRDRRLAKTDRAIQEALLGLLAEVPLSKITVSAIARRADIDRKTFYLHYDTVDDAYAAFASSTIDKCMTGLDEELEAISTREDAFNEIFRTYFRHVGMLFTDDLDVHVRRLGSVPYDSLLDAFGVPLRRAVVSGRMGLHLPEGHLDYCVSFLLNLTVSTYTTWLRAGMKESLDELTDIASSLASNGLSVYSKTLP